MPVDNLQNLASSAMELIVTVSVVALVWVTLMAGIYQLIRERIRELHLFANAPAQERHVQRIDTGPHVVPHPPAAGR